jgi:hypothetical protein
VSRITGKIPYLNANGGRYFIAVHPVLSVISMSHVVASRRKETAMIQFSCPYCTAVMKFDDAFAGKQVKCLNCQHDMMAPELAVATVSPPPPPPPATDAAQVAPPSAASVGQAVAAAAPPAENQDDTVLERETVRSFVHKFLILLALILAQHLVNIFPWRDSVIFGVDLGSWMHLVIALSIVVFMLMILPPLRRLLRYYIGLVFRVRPRLAAEPELQSQVSKAATYLILFFLPGALLRGGGGTGAGHG